MTRDDFKPGQTVTYRGSYAGARTFSGVVLAESESGCAECPTFIHVRVSDQRNAGIHHVDPAAVRAVDGREIASEVKA